MIAATTIRTGDLVHITDGPFKGKVGILGDEVGDSAFEVDVGDGWKNPTVYAEDLETIRVERANENQYRAYLDDPEVPEAVVLRCSNLSIVGWRSPDWRYEGPIEPDYKWAIINYLNWKWENLYQ